MGIGAFAGLINVISATSLVDEPNSGRHGFGGRTRRVRRARMGNSRTQDPRDRSYLGERVRLDRDSVTCCKPRQAEVHRRGSRRSLISLYRWRRRLSGSCYSRLWRRCLLLGPASGSCSAGLATTKTAMRQLGWPAVRSHVMTYFLSAVFGLAAGFCLTGVNTASDINAASSYTLLSVAAVVMGGCDLVGGRIEPVGVVFAAVTLSLLGTLLGFMRLSSDNIAAVQGLDPDRHRGFANRLGARPMKRLFEQPWIWALLGVVVLWILLSIGGRQVNLSNLSGIVASAALLCVVAIGQMLVVTTGNGAVDLSIPSVMTLSAFMATSVTGGPGCALGTWFGDCRRSRGGGRLGERADRQPAAYPTDHRHAGRGLHPDHSDPYSTTEDSRPMP